jgi:molecular chaperone DnaK
MEAKLAELNKVADGDDKAAIDQAVENLNKELHAFSQKLYEDATAQQEAAGAQPGEEAQANPESETGQGNGDGEAVDADFEVVDEKK